MSRRVVIVGFEGAQPLDVVGPYEVFAAACGVVARRGGVSAPYALSLVAPGAGPIRGESGLALVTDRTLGQVRGEVDTLLVAGGAGARAAAERPEVVVALRRLASRSRRVASVCTGAFPLAATGLLDGKRATTHWAHCENLARRFPEVRVEADPIYVRDGHLWTSAGVTAGIDLSLALVEDDLGREVAMRVAKELVVFVRRAGGQSQFSAQLSAQAAERSALRELQTFVVEHPDAPLDVASMARRSGMSVRNFTRAFRAETGVPPARYVERVRLETARRLLESADSSVEQVAEAAGFGTSRSLHRAFVRRIGLGPREYRARFGASSSKP